MKTRFLIAALALLAGAPALTAGIATVGIATGVTAARAADASAADSPQELAGTGTVGGIKVPSANHPITRDDPAEATHREITDDQRRARNYADQPPLIPHAIRDYQIDLNINKCLTCHDRRNTEGSQAPMISVTHFQDRDGQTLGTVAARRYFCTQCHVPQSDAQPIVPNSFRDFDAVLGHSPTQGLGQGGAK
ncbi:nitrate reductase cytochrome c-type subunit [Azospirillum picis]|uniref:Periplasmic nitrate reductase, electron transfer subunit n=1 Tax=Azospirillum picis TaxID=488438 RepID=A0ABU0MKE5_9PROT|nr:nitrate reductase cytochrome c-type subunit [Azospirillum picis]MBP2300029.1 cytochrome c-type protein NapB [Azospirillum picis]MDQ0533733.1 cytochrome c-type protein NapB [Azospirillum picis]